MFQKIIWTIIVLCGVNQSIACSCDTTTFNKAIAWADEIFIGNIIKAEVLDTGGFYSNWRWKYTFKVSEKWKGSNSSEIEIYHFSNSCDTYFDIYQTVYLIYAAEFKEEDWYGESLGNNPAEGNLYTWLCARNIHKTNFTGNWFDHDVNRLNKKFPEKIKLAEATNMTKLIWIFVLLVVLVSFIIIRNRSKKVLKAN